MTLGLSLATLFSTKLSFHILFSLASRAHPSHEGLWWTEGSCSEASLPGLRINAKRASTRKYLRGLGNLCSRAAYINFLTPFRAAYNQGRLTIEQMRCMLFVDKASLLRLTTHGLPQAQIYL